MGKSNLEAMKGEHDWVVVLCPVEARGEGKKKSGAEKRKQEEEKWDSNKETRPKKR
jgi:hypothetical protein